MKKQLLIIGIIVLLITVGLSGCQQSSQSSVITSIGDIHANANKYINQTVTVQATYYGVGGNSYYMIMDSTMSIYATETNNVVKPTPLVSASQYKFTGIVRYGQPPGSFFSPDVYLEVSKIEAV